MSTTLMFAGFEFIILAFGLTFGFWLLITAPKEEGWKKVIGILFGWIIIIHAIVISSMSCYKWMQYSQIKQSSINSISTGAACPISELAGKHKKACGIIDK